MNYKTDKHRVMAIKFEERMEGVPKFIKDYYSKFKSEVSKYNYWPHLNNLLQWLYDKQIISTSINDLTPEELNKVTSTDIINYLKELQNGIGREPNRLSTIETKMNSFSGFWSYLVKKKFVEDNVVKDIPAYLFRTEVENHTVKIPTQEQLDSFIDRVETGNGNEFDCIRNTAIVQLFLGSGIRSEELMGLDITDLHLSNDIPYIKVLGRGKMEVKDEVIISIKAKHYLEEYLIARGQYIKDKEINNEPALFLSNQGNRLSKNSITRFFENYSDGQINPHMLRHWVGTEIYKRTQNIVLVQKQLRHKSIEKTIEYYVPVEKEDLASVMLNL